MKKILSRVKCLFIGHDWEYLSSDKNEHTYYCKYHCKRCGKTLKK